VTGFIRGLFGSSQPSEKTEKSQAGSVPSSDSGAFFLDSDSAKSLGDLDYMRASKTVKRTFPKTASDPEEKAVTVEISAMTKRVNGTVQTSASSAEIASQPISKPQSDVAAERRQADSSMDLFRNMAREIRK
jgi:hypothetical protein